MQRIVKTWGEENARNDPQFFNIQPYSSIRYVELDIVADELNNDFCCQVTCAESRWAGRDVPLRLWYYALPRHTWRGGGDGWEPAMGVFSGIWHEKGPVVDRRDCGQDQAFQSYME